MSFQCFPCCMPSRYTVKLAKEIRKFNAAEFFSMDIAKLGAIAFQKAAANLFVQFECRKGKDREKAIYIYTCIHYAHVDILRMSPGAAIQIIVDAIILSCRVPGRTETSGQRIWV